MSIDGLLKFVIPLNKNPITVQVLLDDAIGDAPNLSGQVSIDSPMPAMTFSLLPLIMAVPLQVMLDDAISDAPNHSGQVSIDSPSASNPLDDLQALTYV